MKVLMVLNRYYPMIGGAEAQCQRLVRELRRQESNIDITVVTSNHDGLQSQKSFVDDVVVLRLKLSPFGIIGFYIRLLFFFFISGRQFDVFHCHNISNVGVLCGCVARLLGKVCILKLTVDGELDLALSSSGFVGAIKSRLLRFALASTEVVALTQHAREELIRNNIRHFDVIPNGIDAVAFRQLIGDRRNIYDCGYVGRFSDQKRLGFLVSAFKEGKKRSLLMVGGSELQKHYADATEVESVIKKSGGLIVSRGAQNPPVDFFRDVKVYVSTSAKEGLSNSLLEALALNMPCILSDIPSHREMMVRNPKACIQLFETKDELKNLLANDQLFGLEAGDDYLSQEFMMENVGLRYLELYKRNVAV